MYRLTRLVEKPTPEFARVELVTPGLGASESGEGRYLVVFGQYILPAKRTFDILEENIRMGRRERCGPGIVVHGVGGAGASGISRCRIERRSKVGGVDHPDEGRPGLLSGWNALDSRGCVAQNIPCPAQQFENHWGRARGQSVLWTYRRPMLMVESFAYITKPQDVTLPWFRTALLSREPIVTNLGIEPLVSHEILLVLLLVFSSKYSIDVGLTCTYRMACAVSVCAGGSSS